MSQRFFDEAAPADGQKPAFFVTDERFIHVTEGVCLYEGEKITDAFDESVCYLTNHFIYLVARDSRMVRLALSQIVSEPEFIEGSVFASEKIKCSIVEKTAASIVHRASFDAVDWVCSFCTFANRNEGIVCSQCGNEKSFWNCTFCTFRNDASTRSKVCCMCHKTQPGSHHQHIRLSFRKKGAKDFLVRLKQTLSLARWKALEGQRCKFLGAAATRLVGVGAILEANANSAQKNQQIDDSFKNLNSLAQNLNEIASMAATISDKISKKDFDLGDAESRKIATLISRIGIGNPVFKKFSKNYKVDLLHEFNQFLTHYMQSTGLRVICMSDVFCLYNRARGIEFVSPSLLFKLCDDFSAAGIPFICKKFASGARAIMHTSFTDDALFDKIMQQTEANAHKCISATSLKLDGVSVSFVKDLLRSMEIIGILARDETTAGVKYYKNII